ncbi:hypothetical protein Tco_0842828 [Tanacetum coccineum]|uniref:Uncharacterized protein n=1 Tax=Tanacetum coccineum TaxID=301880 RepID=A0ABQ5B190_9ASTR
MTLLRYLQIHKKEAATIMEMRRDFSLEVWHESNQAFQSSNEENEGIEMSHQLRTSFQTSLAKSQSKKLCEEDSTLPLQEGHEIEGISMSRAERFHL